MSLLQKARKNIIYRFYKKGNIKCKKNNGKWVEGGKWLV